MAIPCRKSHRDSGPPGSVEARNRRFSHNNLALPTAYCRRVAAQLNQEGFVCSVGLVANLMRELGLAAIQPRAYKRTTITDDQAQIFDDYLDPQRYTPGEALVSDITYLRTGEGWLYLATIIDLATRMVVGWQLADHMRTSLVIDALEMAQLHGRIGGEAILHSD